MGGGLRGHAAPEWTGWASGHVAGKVALTLGLCSRMWQRELGVGRGEPVPGTCLPEEEAGEPGSDGGALRKDAPDEPSGRSVQT